MLEASRDSAFQFICSNLSENIRIFILMETVEVQFTTAGQPLRVQRQGRVWAVIAEPVRWFERVKWWESELRAPKGASFRIDVLVWQVQVSLGAKTSDVLTWELMQHSSTGGWRVREAAQAIAA